MGIDLHVNDVRNPEHFVVAVFNLAGESRQGIHAGACGGGIEAAVRDTVPEGDGTELLPDIVKSIPEEAVICVFHTHVANQIPEASSKSWRIT